MNHKTIEGKVITATRDMTQIIFTNYNIFKKISNKFLGISNNKILPNENYDI
jgi:hypothetical protein